MLFLRIRLNNRFDLKEIILVQAAPSLIIGRVLIIY